MNQIKFISANRLYVKESEMNKEELIELKKSVAELLGLSIWSPSFTSDHRIAPNVNITRGATRWVGYGRSVVGTIGRHAGCRSIGSKGVRFANAGAKHGRAVVAI